MSQTWYQAEGSKLAEIWTILHLPYTLMNLSFLTIGFGLAGIHRWDVFGWILLAYFLGLGIAAHSFDQLPGMGSNYIKHLTPKELWMIGLPALGVAVLIGAYWMIELKAWHLLWIIPLQTFFVWAYPNSKFMKGFFHDDFWFAVSFGFIPVMTGFYINNLSFSITIIPWAATALIISLIEITLSRYVRNVRKVSTDNTYLLIISLIEITLSRYVRNVRKTNTDNTYLIKPELALKLLCLMSYSLALSIIMWS